MAAPDDGGAAAGSLPKRLAFKHDGRTIYEWEQGYEEVNVFIAPPPGVTAKLVDCKISVGHVRLGVKGNPPYLDVREQTVSRACRCALPSDVDTTHTLPGLPSPSSSQTFLLAGRPQWARCDGPELLDDGCVLLLRPRAMRLQMDLAHPRSLLVAAASRHGTL
jgi:hypothetical protein